MDTIVQPTLLLIADDPQVRYLIKRYAGQRGCRVINSNSVDEAVVQMLHDRPTMVLLHVITQPYDGWLTLRQLKAEQALVDIPITVIAAIMDEARARAEGAAYWLWQPVMYDDFLAVLDSTTGTLTSTEA